MKTITRDDINIKRLYDIFPIEEEYDIPENYTDNESYFGEGKYPPDWDGRRSAIWFLQSKRCARCGNVYDSAGHLHHIRPLSDKGTNHLENLVGLCAHCHKLIHPEVSDLDGDLYEAQKFPCNRAEPEVAVIKRKEYNELDIYEEIDEKLGKLDGNTDIGKSWHAIKSPAVYNINATLSKKFSCEGDNSLKYDEDRNDKIREIENNIIRELIERDIPTS